MDTNITKAMRVPVSIIPTLKKIKEVYGCKKDKEAFEILADFFNKRNVLKKNVQPLFEKLDSKLHKINELLRLRIELNHIVNIIADEIDESNLTVSILKKYLFSRKVYF